MRKILFAITALFCAATVNVAAQTSPEEFLRNTYPQLCGIFENDLNSVHCTYIFAVDVSGTMKKLAPTVQPALVDFVKALPETDNVNIIKFGNEAKLNAMGYVGQVGAVRNTLISNIGRLYTDENDKDIRSLTNIPKMLEAVTDALRNSESDLNFVFVLTDYKNEEDKSGGNQISGAKVEELHSNLEKVTRGQNGKVVLLKLPLAPTNMKGECCDQVADIVSGLDLRSQTVPVPDGSALGQWFKELRKEVLVSKLRAIVDKENRVAAMEFNPEIDINGNTTTSLRWSPNRLFTRVKIDSTVVIPAGAKNIYHFKNRIKGPKDKHVVEYLETDETTLEDIELGQIKCNHVNFANCKDSLKFGIDLPTSFDDELDKLGIEKPVPYVTRPIDRLIFTFPLPFGLCVLIIVLIILYIILFFRAIGVNKSKKFAVKKITITDASGNELASKSFGGKKMDGFTVPGIVSCSGMPGKLEFFRKNGNPFLLFQKPRLRVSSTCVVKGQGSKEFSFKKGTPIVIGKSKSEFTHKVTVF